MLAALAVGGVSGSKNGLAPPLGVGGSGVRNGAATDEASACAELEAAVSSCPVALVSASALRFRLSCGRDRGVGLLTSRASCLCCGALLLFAFKVAPNQWKVFPHTAFRGMRASHQQALGWFPSRSAGHDMRPFGRCS